MSGPRLSNHERNKQLCKSVRTRLEIPEPHWPLQQTFRRRRGPQVVHPSYVRPANSALCNLIDPVEGHDGLRVASSMLSGRPDVSLDLGGMKHHC